MILKVLANAGEMYLRFDAEFLHHAFRSDARDLEDLGRVNSSCRQDDFPFGLDCANLHGVAIYELCANCSPTTDEYFLNSIVSE